MTQPSNEYTPQLINTKQLMDQYWPAVAPLLDKFVRKVTPNEQTLGTMYDAILSGQSYLWVIKADTVDGPDVKLAMTVEVVQYPLYTALRINALSGRDLVQCANKYWEFMKGWAYMIGFRAFEAHVPPALERLLRRYGFNRTKSCIHVRLPLVG